MKQNKYKIILLASVFLVYAGSITYGATILQTQTTDTLGTFRTNVNTSLVNLNTDNASTSPTIGFLTATSTATSTFAWSINVPTGQCFQINGTCLPTSVGITTLNTLTGATQTFSANGPLAIVSGGTVHTFNASSSPYFGTLTATGTVNLSLGAGAVSSAASGVLSAGTLTVANGGTASTTLGGLLFGNGSALGSVIVSSPLTWTQNGGTLACSTCLTGNQTITLSGVVTGSGATAITTSFNGTTTLFSLLAGNGNQLISATTTSPLAYTQAGGLTCTNCLNTANANGPLAIVSSNSTYTFNASSSPTFGVLYATSSAYLATSGGNVGIGTTSPSVALSVQGSALISGTTTVGTLIATSSLIAPIERTIVVASSTLNYIGQYAAAGTTTLIVANYERPVTMLQFYCMTDIGSGWIAFGIGTASTTYAKCSNTGTFTSLSSNNTWATRQRVYLEIGALLSAPNIYTITTKIQ